MADLPQQGDALADPSDDDAGAPLRALLPKGAAWGTPDGQALEPQSVLYRFWTAVGAGFADAYRALFSVAMQSTSVTLDVSLDDWEVELGLPDPCLAESGSAASRLLAVRSKVLASAIVTPADFIGLAFFLGYTITIEEPKPFQCGVSECGGDDEIAGSETGQVEWDFLVRIYDQPVRFFECGISECGVDALTDWDPARDLECLFRRIAPAWARPVFLYGPPNSFGPGFDGGFA